MNDILVPKQPGTVRIGNFLFHYRNLIGPVVYVLALIFGEPFRLQGHTGINAVLDIAGVVVALIGQSLRVVTIGYDYIERGGRNRRVHASKLVQGGVFNHMRNPLYVGNILIGTGLALIVNSPVFYLFVLPFVVFSYVCIVAAEEDFLARRFGSDYAVYRRRVGRWWPTPGRWHESTAGMRFNWSRVLSKEYNTLFLLGLSMAVFKVWADFRLAGASALPAWPVSAVAFAIWLSLYLIARTLKKQGRLGA